MFACLHAHTSSHIHTHLLQVSKSFFQRSISPLSNPQFNQFHTQNGVLNEETTTDGEIYEYDDTDRHTVVVTTSGPDRVGVVSEFSKSLSTFGANIEESRMAMLGSDFAIIMLVSVPEAVSTEMVRDRVQETFPDNMVSCRSTDPTASQPSVPSKLLEIVLQGPDQPDVTTNFTDILTKHDCSILELDTETSSAAFAGYSIFTLRTMFTMPEHCDQESFETALVDFEDACGFDLELNDPSDPMNADDGDFDDDEAEEVDFTTVQTDAPADDAPKGKQPAGFTKISAHTDNL